MAAGLVWHNITTSTGVTFALAQWVPDTASADALAKAVQVLFDSAGVEISPARERWKAGSGVGFTWTDAFSTATLNSIASGNAILSDIAISNQTALDKYMDVSIALGSAVFAGVGANISIHLYPLNKDGSTYGDGKFASSAAGPPAYPPVAVIPLVVGTQAQTGASVGIVIPPGTFKLVFCNNGGVALASSGNTCQYRTYN